MRVSVPVAALMLLMSVGPSIAQQKPAPAAPQFAAAATTSPAQKFTAPALAPARPAIATPAAPALTPAKIDGFRKAKFGMSEDEVRDAIMQDYGMSDSDVKRDTNPVQMTTALTVDVKDLLPGTGLARVTYLFGYKSSKLFSVVIVWARALSAADTQEVLVEASAVLRAHFETESFPKGVLVDNSLPDGSVLVFRGVDGQGRMVALTATGVYTPVGQKEAAQPDPVLRLTYIEDPQHPDVYTIKQGEF